MPAGIELYNYVINQKGSPALYSDTLANRPPAGYPGRLFISTDTQEIYRDTGVIWQLIGSGGPDTNIYNTDGTLLANRTMLMDGKTLTFEGLAQTNRVIMSADNNVPRIFSFRTAGVQRWAFRVDGNETGSNAGADLALRAYDDAGTFTFAPITAERRTGELTLRSQETITTGGGVMHGIENQATGTYIGGLTLTGTTNQAGAINRLNAVTDGSLTVSDGVRFGGGQSKLRIAPSGAGTVTLNQATTQRAAAAHINELQYDSSTAAVTYTHAAVMQNRGIFRTSAANSLTITNAYSLLLNDLNEAGYGNLTLTNRWGVYQAGQNDINFLAANTLIGANTPNTGERLQVFGNQIIKSGYLDIDTSGQSRRISSKNATGGDGQNTFIGNGGENIVAAPSNVNGSYNTSLGASALFNLTSGYSNTALGQYAQFTLTTGYDNATVGVNSGAEITNGHSNVSIGNDSLRRLTTGNSITAIGKNAGTYVNTAVAPAPPYITTNTSCVYIGSDTRSNADGSTNEIVIGANGRGLGSNTAVYGDTAMTSHIFRAGNVGIGTTSPINKLSVISDNNTYGQLVISASSNNGNVTGGLTFGGLWNTDAINFYTANNATAKMSISNGGNVFINNTTDTGETLQVTGNTRINGSLAIDKSPLGWSSAYSNLQIGLNGALFSNNTIGTDILLSSNTLYNTLNTFRYIVNGRACFIELSGGNIRFYTSSISGVAGNTISFGVVADFGFAGNFGLGGTTYGTSATRTVAISNGTAPASSVTDAFQLYSNDITAGNAAAHFRTENGAVIKVYQETTAVAAATLVGGGGTTITDTDTFGGYTLQQVVQALRNQGLLA
jgi:hypothetical protein